MSSPESPEYSPFFGVIGASAAMVFSGKCGLGGGREENRAGLGWAGLTALFLG